MHRLHSRKYKSKSSGVRRGSPRPNKRHCNGKRKSPWKTEGLTPPRKDDAEHTSVTKRVPKGFINIIETRTRHKQGVSLERRSFQERRKDMAVSGSAGPHLHPRRKGREINPEKSSVCIPQQKGGLSRTRETCPKCANTTHLCGGVIEGKESQRNSLGSFRERANSGPTTTAIPLPKTIC